MPASRGILYLGEDFEFFKRLQAFAVTKKITLNEIFSAKYSTGALTNHCTEFYPSIVFVDFLFLETQANAFFSELIFLKKIDTFKSILFVALFSNKQEQQDFSYIFTSGFQLSFIKGCEENILFSNSFNIGYGERNNHAQYVKAKNINLPMKLGFCSTLTAISNESFIIETDIAPIESVVSLKLDIFPELKAETFNIMHSKVSNNLFPMLETIILEYPFLGPWDTTLEDKIKKETIDDWIEVNSTQLEKHQIRIHVITKKQELIAPFFNSAKTLGIFLELQENFNIDVTSTLDELSLKRPDLIFVDLEDYSDTDKSLEHFSNITNSIRSIENYRPIIIITNNDSKSEALQNIYGYKSLIVIPGPITVDIFKSFISKLLEKKTPDQSHLSLYYFSETNRQRSIDVNHQVIISSLSELEFSFYSLLEIPMFSVLHLTVPLDCYATVVPLASGLQKESRGWGYTAIIHGLSEDELTSLRKIVNQIIYKPLQEFTAEEVNMILIQKELLKVAPEATPKPDEKVINEAPKPDHFEALNRIKIKGKSKL